MNGAGYHTCSLRSQRPAGALGRKATRTAGRPARDRAPSPRLGRAGCSRGLLFPAAAKMPHRGAARDTAEGMRAAGCNACA